jgi:hypothetical protein
MATPEEFVAAKEELLRCVNTALTGMPRQWRRALRLRHAKGLTEAELAAMLDKAEPELERILEYARQHLRQRLSGVRLYLYQQRNGKSSEVAANGRHELVSSVRQTRARGRARASRNHF